MENNKTYTMLKLISDTPNFFSYFRDDNDDITYEKISILFEYMGKNEMYDIMMLMLYAINYSIDAGNILEEFQQRAVEHYVQCKGEKYIGEEILEIIRKMK